MHSEEELVAMIRKLDHETLRAFTDMMRAIVKTEDSPAQHAPLLARIEALAVSGNVTAETIREMLADWRREVGYYTYDDAKARVDAEPELQAYRDTILYDWPEGEEHWRWVVEAPVAEIVAWAEVVAEVDA